MQFPKVVFSAFAMMAMSGLVQAAAINQNVWYQFSFTDAGTPAQGCDPADPLGQFCIPPFLTAVENAPEPDWTFNAATPVFLTVVDAFELGDTFEVFDFLAPVDSTSPAASGFCEEPAECLANPSASKLVVKLAAGNHSLRIVPTAAPLGGGSGFFLVTPVPEPSTWVLLSGAFAAIALRRKKQ